MTDQPASPPPGAIVVDFSPVVRFDAALTELADAWEAVPPALRAKLGRLVWLHPDGELVIYRAPDGPPPKGG